MSIYSDNVQQLTDTLVTDVAALQTAVSGAAAVVTAAAVAAGGGGYAVNDTITLANGVVLTVATLSADAVATATITDQGSITTAPPANPQAQISTSGTGTAATFNLTWTTPDVSGITSAANTVQTDVNNLSTAIQGTDIPPDGTMINNIVSDLTNEVSTLQSDITAYTNDMTAIIADTNAIAESTQNLDYCVDNMAGNQVPPLPPISDMPLPPWFSVTAPSPGAPPSGTKS
jgi:hypothetical protein